MNYAKEIVAGDKAVGYYSDHQFEISSLGDGHNVSIKLFHIKGGWIFSYKYVINTKKFGFNIITPWSDSTVYESQKICKDKAISALINNIELYYEISIGQDRIVFKRALQLIKKDFGIAPTIPKPTKPIKDQTDLFDF